MTAPEPGTPLYELARRTEKITKLFLILGMDGTPEKLAGWVEATERVPWPALLLGCRDLVRSWSRTDGFPFPGDLVRAAKPHVARLEAQAADTARAALLPAPEERIALSEIPELRSLMSGMAK